MFPSHLAARITASSEPEIIFREECSKWIIWTSVTHLKRGIVCVEVYVMLVYGQQRTGMCCDRTELLLVLLWFTSLGRMNKLLFQRMKTMGSRLRAFVYTYRTCVCGACKHGLLTLPVLPPPFYIVPPSLRHLVHMFCFLPFFFCFLWKAWKGDVHKKCWGLEG